MNREICPHCGGDLYEWFNSRTITKTNDSTDFCDHYWTQNIFINNKGEEMKKLIETNESEGLESLMGERVTIYCCRYIYTGDLVGLDKKTALLKDCGIVYETGPHSDKKWKNYEKMPKDFWYVKRQAIESFGIMKDKDRDEL